MLDFAQRYDYERATVRIPQLIAALPEPRSTRAVLHALLIDLLARAAVDPQAAATARTVYDGVTGFLATQLRVAQTDGVLPAHL
ncbi:MAG: hypothetical protein ACLQFR_10660, partial [Streptosporangiaceae bacterium]